MKLLAVRRAQWEWCLIITDPSRLLLYPFKGCHISPSAPRSDRLKPFSTSQPALALRPSSDALLYPPTGLGLGFRV